MIILAEGGGGSFHVDGEGFVDGAGITLVEEIDELFQPNGLGIRDIAVLDEAAGHGEGSGIHVYGEGGEAVVFGVDEGVDAGVLEEGGVVGFVVYRCGAADGVKAFGEVRRGRHTLGRGGTSRFGRDFLQRRRCGHGLGLGDGGGELLSRRCRGRRLGEDGERAIRFGLGCR